jgi:cytolethal distending toxin subunit B
VILTTWNMQGGNASTEDKWNTGVANMLGRSFLPPDAMCLQEAGAVPASAKLRETKWYRDPDDVRTKVTVYDWGGTQTRGGRSIVYHRWDTEGNRVNTAVVTQDRLRQVSVKLVWPNAGPVWRPAVGVRVEGEWIFSFHGISPGGADAPNALTRVANATGGTMWRVGGDFNREPWTLAGHIPAVSVVCDPQLPTHSVLNPQHMYDYFVCGGGPARTGLVIQSIGMSDHRPVQYHFA